MTAVNRSFLQLHLAVFLWGFTAVLGDLIQLSALGLVWWRVAITSVCGYFLLPNRSVLRTLARRHIWKFAFAGVLTGIHWVAFYGAVKLSNASVTLVCMATCAFFTSLFEPFLMRSKVKIWEIFTGFLIVPGMVLIAGNVDVSMRAGLAAGLFASLLAAVFSTLNKKWIGYAEPYTITFIQMTSAWVFLSLVMPVFFYLVPAADFWPSAKDLGLLLVLSLLCTTFTWVLVLRALRHVSAFTSTLIVNLEPVYGIFLAWLLLDDAKELSPGFYRGVALILVVVLGYPVLKKRGEKNAPVEDNL